MSLQVAIAQINSTVGDLAGNSAKIADFSRRAAALGADIVLTPELSLTGYPPEDLLLRNVFHDKTIQTLDLLAAELSALKDVHVLVGHHVERGEKRFNACSVLVNGSILGTYFKHDLPNYTVFDEKRYFVPGDEAFVFDVNGIRLGINICEDVWFGRAPAQARAAGAQVLLVPNSSPYHMNKLHDRYDIVRENVAGLGMSIVYANMVGGQDELIFDGNSFVMNPQGTVCAQMKHCDEDLQVVGFDGVTPLPGSIAGELSTEGQVYQALVLGVRDYVGKNGFPGGIIGLSGGVDSALTLAVAVDALGADRVRAVMMPSPYTSEISWLDSRDMVKRIGVRYDEIPIDECFTAFRHTLASQFEGLQEDATEENIQARIRGTILMALSNKFGSIVLTTGNKSEMAVGYCTLYGDMAGGFAVIKDIAKTLVYRLCRYRNKVSDVIPERILTRAPSAELKPGQLDQDSLPPYEVLDAIVQMFMEENMGAAEIINAGYDKAVVERITHLMKINEYKRRQSPVGIRITPRGFGRDWRYPITSKFRD
jgi:NAD+ synthase (glutamine-hydrolysing)